MSQATASGSLLADATRAARLRLWIAIVGELGTPLFRSRELPADNSALSDRAYFIAHRDHPNLGVVVSDPLITQIEHRPAVIMARRLEKRDGSFDGIVQAVVDLEDFQRLYQALDLGEGSAMNLLRDDGTLFVRQPQSPQAVGAKFPELVATASKSARLTTRAAWMGTLDIHPDGLPRVETAVADHFAGRTERYEVEYRLRHPDGEWHWLQARGRCIRDASGKLARLVGSAIDVTARKS